MFENKRVGALLLMAGVGKRLGGEIPKQYLPLAGMPVYLHTLQSFLNVGFFDEILLVCLADWIPQVKMETARHWPLVRPIAGGPTRQASSFAGLCAFSSPPDLVVIHDAVRPFVSEAILHENVCGASNYGAVDTCIPSADTLVYAPKKPQVTDIPKRADFLRGQTPQSFRFDWICRAHEAALQAKFEATDDCKLVLDLGLDVFVVPGSETNIKITTHFDFLVAEQILKSAANPASGTCAKA